MAIWISQYHLLKRLSFPNCTSWFFGHKLIDHMGFPGGTSGKKKQKNKKPACQCRKQTQVLFQGQKDLLEEEMTTHSSILAWRLPWTEEPGKLQCIGLQRVEQDTCVGLFLALYSVSSISVSVCVCACVCECANTRQFWLPSICNIIWNQKLWCLQLCSLFCNDYSGSLGIFHDSIWMLGCTCSISVKKCP